MIVLLIAGIAVILAGLAAIGFGIPVKEFGFGNTLILTGAVGVCTGLIMVSLGLVVREMRRLAAVLATTEPRAAVPLPRRELKLPPAPQDIDDESEETQVPPFFAREMPPPSAPPVPKGPEPGVPPWQDEVLRDRERLAATAGSTAEEPKRRNLLFTSTRRDREKDRTDAVAQALELDLGAPAATPPREEVPRFDDAQQVDEAPRFEDTWPRGDRPSSQPDRPRFSDAIRQAARASAIHAERSGDRLPDPSEIPDRDEPAPAAPARAPGVTVLKSGVVDGMAYSLYSDGSIEAQMPEGLMRFASIDELREHLENRS